MEDEQNYESHLLTYEDALACLPNSEQKALKYAWAVYNMTLEHQENLAQQRLKSEQEQQQQEAQSLDSQRPAGTVEIRSEDEDSDVHPDGGVVGTSSHGAEERRRSLGGTDTHSLH